MSENKEKITINGAPPQWSDSEYESRVTGWINVYRNTEQSMELMRSNFEHELFQVVIDKSKQGYTIAANKSVCHGELEHSVWMVKPESQQVYDIAAIKAKVKDEYIEWLESERARYQDMLRQQLIQTQQEKELKALQEKQAKQMAAIEKEVQSCFKPLEIPE